MRITIIAAAARRGAGHGARAVVFPADTAYVAASLRQRARWTTRSPTRAGALDERDIVGDPATPAGLRACDATNLYLRMRLEDDPAPGGRSQPFSWGMEFDLDGDLTDYELLILVDGIARRSRHGRRCSATRRRRPPNDPNDPADQPPVQTYTFATNARTIDARD